MMFGTFVAFEDNNPPPRSRSRRTTVARACVSCQKRKVKCNGAHPCYNCRVAKSECVYTERRRRTTEAPNTGDVNDYQGIVNRLFGTVPIQELLELPREELLSLANGHPKSSSQQPMTSPNEATPSSVAESEAARRIEALEERPGDRYEWDESSDHLAENIEDDVNGLVAIKVLVKVLPSPILDDVRKLEPKKKEKDSFALTPEKGLDLPIQEVSYHEGQRLIDAYFTHMHVFVPMIQEQAFRATYLSNQRKDSPWLALLNMVFAIGSMLSSPAHSERDILFYQRAREHLRLESLGSGHMETLHAIILMGGSYLHYRNRPNLASALMGAANRIACSMGLHRESAGPGRPEQNLEREVNRRTWWSIYVLDSWASTTLGRPLTFEDDRVDIPKNMANDQCDVYPLSQPTIYSPLIHSIIYSRLTSKIQPRLQMSSFLAPQEIAKLDGLLVKWYDAMPNFMRPPNICPPELLDARNTLTWRYQNMRIILHRVAILDSTDRQIPFDYLGPEEQEVVSKCRLIATDAIFSIQSQWRPNKMCGWQAVWFLFQACLIPLMALAVEPDEHPDYQNWRHQVILAINMCEEMSEWSLVAKKTKEVMQRLFEATKRPSMSIADITQMSGFEYEPLPNEPFFGGMWSDLMEDGTEYFAGLDMIPEFDGTFAS